MNMPQNDSLNRCKISSRNCSDLEMIATLFRNRRISISRENNLNQKGFVRDKDKNFVEI